MALGDNERWSGGFVRDLLGRLVATVGPFGGEIGSYAGGFARDEDGRLEIVGPDGAELSTAADVSAVDERVDALEAVPRVLLRRDSAQTIPHTGTHNILWEYVEDEHPAGFWDAADRAKAVIPEAGVYQLTVQTLHALNATGFRAVHVYVNSQFVTQDARLSSAAFNVMPALSVDMALMPGDEVVFTVFQNSGGDRDIGNVSFAAAKASVVKVASVPYVNRVVALGDSLSEGEDLNFGYVPTLRSELPTTHVVAAGNAGETTTQIEARVNAEVVLWNPEACVVLAGSNDLNTGVLPAAIEQNLTDIYALLDAADIDTVALTIPPAGMFDATEETRRQEVNTWIRALAAPITVVDADLILRDPADQDSLLDAYDLGDGIHLNAAGNTALAEAIAAVL